MSCSLSLSLLAPPPSLGKVGFKKRSNERDGIFRLMPSSVLSLPRSQICRIGGFRCISIRMEGAPSVESKTTRGATYLHRPPQYFLSHLESRLVLR